MDDKYSTFDRHVMYITLANAVLGSIVSITSIVRHGDSNTSDYNYAAIVGTAFIVIEIIILISALWHMAVEDKAKKQVLEYKERRGAICNHDTCRHVGNVSIRSNVYLTKR